MKVTLQTAENGFIVVDEENEIIGVYEEDDLDEYSDIEALQRALYKIIEHLGYWGSKHDKKRIRVDIEVNEYDS